MDPITAFIDLITVLAKITLTAMEGQTPEQRKQLWDWYIQDVQFWRKLLKIDS